MADFAKIKSEGDKYPRRHFDGDTDQSYGFVTPYKVQTGDLRGTQVIRSADGSRIELGIISGTEGEFGIAMFDEQGRLIRKFVGPTSFIYNPDTSLNVYQDGKLPNDEYGYAAANDGFNVEDGFEDE